MLQQYANMQQQSPMPSVRIPSAPHDSGGLYNPFNMGPLIPGAGSSEGLGPQPPRDMSHQVAALVKQPLLLPQSRTTLHSSCTVLLWCYNTTRSELWVLEKCVHWLSDQVAGD